MKLCANCNQIYDDGMFISSGGICDYCFAMLGLGHTPDYGTIHIDFMRKPFLTPYRHFSSLANFEIMLNKGSELNVTKLYYQEYVRQLQAQESREDERMEIP